MGAINSSPQCNPQINTMVTKVEIDQLIQKFWDVDGISTKREKNIDEKWCEEVFNQTHSRYSTGRYCVR